MIIPSFPFIILQYINCYFSNTLRGAIMPAVLVAKKNKLI